MKEHNIMKIKLFLLAAFGAVLSLSGCRPEQDGPSEDRTVYREVAVSLGQADEEPGTRSLVSIDIEHFQKAALFAFDPQTGGLLSYGPEAGLDEGRPIAVETQLQRFNWTLPVNTEMDIYAIVNYGGLDMASYIRTGLKKSELEVLRFTSTGPSELKRLETSGAGMPMAGIEKDIRLSAAGEGLTVHVKKLYAKFNIWFDLSRVEAEEWQVQAMHMIVENANTEVPYFIEDFRQEDPSKLVEYDRATEEDLDEIQQGGNGHAVTLYMLENCQGIHEGAESWKTVYKDLGFAAVRNCTYIDLSVKVRRSSGEYQDLGYTIYLGTSDMRSDFDIRRNLFKTIKIVLPGPQDPIPASRFFKFSGTESPTVMPGESIDLYFVTNLEREDVSVSLAPDGRLSLEGITWQADEDGIATGSVRLLAATDIPEGATCTVTAGSERRQATDQRTVTASWPTVLEVSRAHAPDYVAQTGYIEAVPLPGIVRLEAEVKSGSEGILEVRETGASGSMFRIGVAGLSVGTGTVILHHFNAQGVETGSQEVDIPIQAPVLRFSSDTFELLPDGTAVGGALAYVPVDSHAFAPRDLERFDLELIRRLLFPSDYLTVDDCTSFVEAVFTRKADSDLRLLRLPVRIRISRLFARGRELDWSEGGTIGRVNYQGALSTRIPYATAELVVLNPFVSLKGKCLGVIDNNLPVYEALKGVPEYMEALGMKAELALNFHSYKNGKSFTIKDGKPVLEVSFPVSASTSFVLSGPEEFQFDREGDKLRITAVEHPAHYTGYGRKTLYAQVVHTETGEISSPVEAGYLDMYLIGAVGPYIHGQNGPYMVGGMVVPEGDRSPIADLAASEIYIRENVGSTSNSGYYLSYQGQTYNLYYQSVEIDDQGIDRFAEDGETSYLNSYRIRSGSFRPGIDVMEFRFGSIFRGRGCGLVNAAQECDRMLEAWFQRSYRTGQLMHFPGASAQEKDPAGYSWCAVVNLFGGNGGPACDLFLETTGK